MKPLSDAWLLEMKARPSHMVPIKDVSYMAEMAEELLKLRKEVMDLQEKNEELSHRLHPLFEDCL